VVGHGCLSGAEGLVPKIAVPDGRREKARPDETSP
jgi:hypothetical protein